MFFGGNYLEYTVFFEHDFAEAQKLGILLVELGVGITVAAVMIIIFFMFENLFSYVTHHSKACFLTRHNGIESSPKHGSTYALYR